MTHTELDQTLDLLRWPTRTFADLLGVSETTCRRWRNGSLGVPPLVGAWLRKLAEAHRALPPPTPPAGHGGRGGPPITWSPPPR